MSARTFIMPSPEDIFNKWVDMLSDARFRGFFVEKGARISRSQVSPAENIENINRRAIIAVFIKIKIPSKLGERRVKVSKIKKIEFYDYDTLESIPIYRTLTKVVCDKCSGSGSLKCTKCGGTGRRRCSYCGGTGHIKCPECGGGGNVEITIKVWTGRESKEKRKISVTCPRCHGTGKIICRECHGVGNVPCSECGGSGRIPCDACDGHGHLIAFKVGPIGSGERTLRYIAPKRLLKSRLLKETLQHLSKVGFLRLKDISDIDPEKIRRITGYELEGVDEARKELERIMGKMMGRTKVVSVTIRLYPVVELDIRTIKNKRTRIAGIGGVDNFVVVELS